MCDPLTLVAMALTAVNTVGTMYAQNQTQKEQDAAVAQARQLGLREEERQKQQRAQAQAMHSQSVQQHTADQYREGLQTEGARLEQAYQPSGTQTSLADTMLSGQSLGSDVVKEDAAAQMSNAVNSAKQRAAALAKVSAYGDVGAGREMNLQDTGSHLNALASMRRGGLQNSQFGQNLIMSTLPTFKPSGFSQLLSAASSLASFGAGMGAGTAAGAAGSAASGGLGNIMIPDAAGFLANVPGQMPGWGMMALDKFGTAVGAPGLAGAIPRL